MTLIAIATYGKHAEFITDTMSYKQGATAIGQTTKYDVLSHIDSAVITQGCSTFGIYAKGSLAGAANELPSLDALLEEAPTVLRELWEANPPKDGHDATIFLVGYSPAADAFQAYCLARDRSDFEPELLEAPHVMPAPFSVAPSALELDRLADDELRSQVGPEYMKALTETWPRRPALQAPKNKAEWVNLALACREQRALDKGRTRTFVGGRVHHTRLSRGKVSTHLIHAFDETGEEFQQMVARTYHPTSLAGPCPSCQSGKAFRECCLAPHLDKACPCGSDKVLGECCASAVLGA